MHEKSVKLKTRSNTKQFSYLLYSLRVLDHLHLRYVVCPRGVFQELRNLSTKVEELGHDGLVDSQAVLKLLVCGATGLWVLGVFKL